MFLNSFVTSEIFFYALHIENVGYKNLIETSLLSTCNVIFYVNKRTIMLSLIKGEDGEA